MLRSLAYRLWKSTHLLLLVHFCSSRIGWCFLEYFSLHVDVMWWTGTASSSNRLSQLRTTAIMLSLPFIYVSSTSYFASWSSSHWSQGWPLQLTSSRLVSMACGQFVPWPCCQRCRNVTSPIQIWHWVAPFWCWSSLSLLASAFLTLRWQVYPSSWCCYLDDVVCLLIEVSQNWGLG